MRAALAKASLVARASPGFGFEREIARPVRPDLGRAGLERGHRANHMRQRLPVDGQRLRRILRLLEAVGDHKGNGIAHVPHHIFRKDRILRDLDVDAGQDAGRRQRAQRRNIGGRQHQPHARHRSYSLEVVNAESRMGVRRAHHDRVQRLAGRDVGDIAPCPAQQRIVFLARERLTESKFHRHWQPPCDCG